MKFREDFQEKSYRIWSPEIIIHEEKGVAPWNTWRTAREGMPATGLYFRGKGERGIGLSITLTESTQQ